MIFHMTGFPTVEEPNRLLNIRGYICLERPVSKIRFRSGVLLILEAQAVILTRPKRCVPILVIGVGLQTKANRS